MESDEIVAGIRRTTYVGISLAGSWVETDSGLGGLVRMYLRVQGKDLPVAGVLVAGWTYGGLSVLVLSFSLV